MRTVLTLLVLACIVGCATGNKRKPAAEIVRARILRSDNKVFQGALAQLLKPATYDDRYYSLSYPGGDVPSDRGACADVIVRALRNADRDLQELIHEDVRHGSYPRIARPDANIDHRRVLNQEVFLQRHGKVLTSKVDVASLPTWRAGDIVSWRLPTGNTHIGVVSDTKRSDGVPFVIHNIGQTAEEDALTRWRIYGHYRYP